MKLRLDFIKETDKARLYRRKSGEEIWIPRSVITKTLKWPPVDNRLPIHDLTVDDWWCEQNVI